MPSGDHIGTATRLPDDRIRLHVRAEGGGAVGDLVQTVTEDELLSKGWRLNKLPRLGAPAVVLPFVEDGERAQQGDSGAIG